MRSIEGQDDWHSNGDRLRPPSQVSGDTPSKLDHLGFADRAARIGFVFSMMFFAAAALYGFWLSGRAIPYTALAIDFADRQAANLGYRIETLDVTGVRRTPKAVVNQALRLPHSGSIFSYNTSEARTRLLNVGWIETADVRRNAPSKLEVTVTERQPFARYSKDGETSVISRDGKRLGDDADNAFAHLFLVTGENADVAAPSLIDSLTLAQNVGDKVESAELVADRFWTLKLKGGIEAKLPRKVTALSLSRLETLLVSEKISDMPVEKIDLRLPHRTVLQLKDATTDLRDKTIARLTGGLSAPEVTAGKSRPL